MYKVFVWVPTKGRRKVAACRDADKAREVAREFEPLEVQVQHGERKWWGGQFCVVEWDIPANHNTLADIK